MIILTMQLQRIVAKMLGNLKTINLLLSCLCKKAFCNDNGHRHAEICKYRLGDMTTNYHRIRSKFSRTAKVVIDRAFILLHASIFYNGDLNWILSSPRGLLIVMAFTVRNIFFMLQLYDRAGYLLGKV